MQMQGIFSRMPFVFLEWVVKALDVSIPAMLRDDGALGDPLPLCHSERCRSTRDGKRGTPRMSAP